MRRTICVVLALCWGLAGEALASAPGDLSPQANRELLAANAKKPGVVILPSGLQYRVIKAGTGQTPTADDQVVVTYKGTRVDGYVFDQTKEGETRTFTVKQLIPGWTEALTLMKEGDEWEIVVPPKIAYGEARTDNPLWGLALTFNMHLISVVHAKP